MRNACHVLSLKISALTEQGWDVVYVLFCSTGTVLNAALNTSAALYIIYYGTIELVNWYRLKVEYSSPVTHTAIIVYYIIMLIGQTLNWLLYVNFYISISPNIHAKQLSILYNV